MLVPWCASLDPRMQQFDVVRTQTVPRCSRWHAIKRVIGADTTHEFTGVGVMRHDCGPTARTCRQKPLLSIQSQPAFTRSRVRPVALEAILREQWPDLISQFTTCCQRETKKGQHQSTIPGVPNSVSRSDLLEPLDLINWQLQYSRAAATE